MNISNTRISFRFQQLDSAPMEPVQLSDLDQQIVRALSLHGRLPYKELAAEVGIPVSTCHGRVRALEQRGVIQGYRAAIAPEALGLNVSALIQLRVHSHRRAQMLPLTEKIRQIPGVQQLFLIGGERDIIVHVSCTSVQALRTLVAEAFAKNTSLAQTQTQIVFEHLPGTRPLGTLPFSPRAG